MSNTIQFSRDELIESSYDVAIIKLNTFNHVVGQPVLVRYYDSQSRVNSILAVGILDGPGKDNYTIISNGAIEPVTGVYNTRLPDVSSLVNDEVYVCYDSNDVPSYCYLEGAAKSYTPIATDRTFYSALDGFLWFVSGGVIRRSDAPIDQSTLAELIQELVNNGSLEIKEATKNLYTWSEKPDGVTTDPYAKVFDIPYGHSVIMAVFAQAPFGNYYADIITYGKGSGNWGYSLTTKTKNFLIAKSGNQPIAVVHKSVSNSTQYTTTYKFMVLSSTCRENQIQWFTKNGWNGDVYELTTIGSGDTKESLNNYITLNYGTTGTSTANLGSGNNFIADTRGCKDKTITTKLINIPSTNDSYKFVINSDVQGFNVTDSSNRPLLNISQKLYSGTVVTVTKVDDVWTYSTNTPNIISSDSSLEIITNNQGQYDITVNGGSSNREFVWSKSAGLSTFSSLGVTQYSWVRVLNIDQELLTQDTLITVEFKCKELELIGNLSFSINSSIAYVTGSHEFYKKVSENFEFSREENVTGGYYFYARPKYPGTLRTFEVKTISSGVTWDYSSANASTNNPNPYKTKNSYLVPLTLEIFTTDQVIEGSNKLVTSGAVYDKIGEIVTGNTEELAERIVALEENTVSSIIVNGDTILPEDGAADLGILYGPDNTEILNTDTVVNGVLAKRGSLVLLDSNGNYNSIICLSSNSKFYKFTANSLGWWNLGKVVGYSGIRVSVWGTKLPKVTGDIWKLGNNKYVTNNETLAGYIKSSSEGNLVIKGSSVHPVTIEIEDYSEDFNYLGTALSSTPTVSTIGVTRSDVLGNTVNLTTPFTSSEIPNLFIVSGNTNPSINIQKSESSIDCFTFNIIFKDNQSKSLTVNLGVGSSNYPINLSRITTVPGLIYTVTYKQDELIYTTKVDSTNPLTVSDLGVTVEAISNKVVSITEESTDNQYPTAKAVWNIFKGKYTQDFKKTAEYDSANSYPYQAALKVTTPAILDVYWSNDSGTFSDTLYVNGKKGSPGTYNMRCHNQLGVFSLKYYGGDFYVCIPALPSSGSSANTYNFIMSAVGKGEEVTSSLFFSSTIPSSFVGESLEFVGDQIYNLDSTPSITDFNFLDYDTILATFPSGNSVSIKGTTLPEEDKVYSFINNTGRDLTNVYVEGRNSQGIISKINIGNVQAGAIVTLAYVKSTNSFDYSISLQSFISPKGSIDITKGVDQWKFDISSELLDKINNPVQVTSVLSEGTKIATVGDTDIFISPEAGQEELTISPTVTVGGITAGMDLDSMTPGEILRQMLTPYVGPRISSMTVSTPVMLYGKTYSNVVINAVGKAGSRPVRSMTIDGSTYSDVVSLSKSKRIDSITPRDSSISTITYQSSISDVDDVVGTGSASIQLVGGVFIFFSSNEELPTTNLDFITYGCQSERTEIKGIYENIYHEDDAYLYIVAPNTSKMEIKSIKSSGYVVPIDLIGTRTLRQGTGDLFVSVDMRIYRSDRKHNAGYFSCEINNPTI